MAGAVATRERETGREHVRVKLKKVYNLTGFLQKFTPFLALCVNPRDRRRRSARGFLLVAEGRETVGLPTGSAGPGRLKTGVKVSPRE